MPGYPVLRTGMNGILIIPFSLGGCVVITFFVISSKARNLNA